jgi:hypothetical protein
MQSRTSRHPVSHLLRLLAALSLIAWGQTAMALTDRAHLEKWCTHESSVAAGRCIGYLLAAEDALAGTSIEGIRACLPGNIRLQEQHLLVVNWLKANPDTQAQTALGLVARAYAEKYPCKQ